MPVEKVVESSRSCTTPLICVFDLEEQAYICHRSLYKVWGVWMDRIPPHDIFLIPSSQVCFLILSSIKRECLRQWKQLKTLQPLLVTALLMKVVFPAALLCVCIHPRPRAVSPTASSWWELTWAVTMAASHLWGNNLWTKWGRWMFPSKSSHSTHL